MAVIATRSFVFNPEIESSIELYPVVGLRHSNCSFILPLSDFIFNAGIYYLRGNEE